MRSTFEMFFFLSGVVTWCFIAIATVDHFASEPAAEQEESPARVDRIGDYVCITRHYSKCFELKKKD